MIEFEAAIAFWQRSSEVHAELWALHLFVVLAAFGFAMTRGHGVLSPAWRSALAFLFFNLAVVNGWSIWDNLTLYNAAIHNLQLASAAGTPQSLLTDALHHIDAGHLLAVHALLDVAVLFALIRKPQTF